MSWYYAQSNQPAGPIPDAEFMQLVAQGVIDASTLVWREGMPQWLPWANIRDEVMAGRAPAGADPAPPAPGQTGNPLTACVACKRFFPVEELVELGGRRVCAECKPVYLQRLREGVVGWSSHGASTLVEEGLAHGTLTEQELLERDYDVPAVQLFTTAGGMLREEPETLLVGGVLITIVMGATNIVPYVGFILQMVFWGPLMGGLALAYLRRIRGGTITAGDVFGGFSNRFGSLLLAYFVPSLVASITVGVAVGATLVMGLTLGPGTGGPLSQVPEAVLGVGMITIWVLGMAVYFYLAVSWMYVLPLVADRHYRLMDAMRLSRKIIGKHFWQHFWMLFLSGLVATVGMLLCCVGLLIAVPLIALAGTLLYERVFHGLASKTPH